jgi:hypothetical protein
MAEEVKTGEAGPAPNEGEESRTFTQEELDKIVESRILDVKKSFSDYEDLKKKAQKYDEDQEAQKTEAQKAADKNAALQAELDQLKKENKVREIHEKVSKETGVPMNLLLGDDEESCTTQAKAILEFAKAGKYPQVPDGGETHAPTMTKEQIFAIKNEKERIKAIEANIGLFEKK